MVWHILKNILFKIFVNILFRDFYPCVDKINWSVIFTVIFAFKGILALFYKLSFILYFRSLLLVFSGAVKFFFLIIFS